MNPKDIKEMAVKAAKQKLILDAAKKVFAEKGLHDTRLEDIGKEAGFSKASLYNYYEDKEDIFLNMGIQVHQEFLATLKREVDAEPAFVPCLRKILRAVFSLLGEHFALMLTVRDVQADFYAGKKHQELKKDFGRLVNEVNRIFASMMTRARNKGEIQSPLKDEALAGFLGSLIRGTIFKWKMSGKMGDVDEAISDIVGFVLSGVEYAAD